MTDALVDMRSHDWKDAYWRPLVLIKNIRKGGPEGKLYQLEAYKLHMGFLNISRPHYAIYHSKYEIGMPFTSQTYIEGPFIELSFIIRLLGAMVLKDIDSVNLSNWQFGLTHTTFVDSKVRFEKDANGETLDFYFTVAYLEYFCRCYPALAPLVNDYHRGKPHNFLRKFPFATPEIQVRVRAIRDYIYNNNAKAFDYLVLDEMVEDLLVAVLTLKKNMIFHKLSPANQKSIQEVAMALETNFDQEVNIAEMANNLAMNMTYFERAFKEVFGFSPRAYRYNAIMKEAMVLLKGRKNDDSSLSEIALKLGYLSVKAYSKAFTEYYGYPPSRVK